MQEEVYLIDGSSYIYRAYHAIAPLSNSKGVPTHAVLGFVNMVKRLIREKQPKYLAIAFDSRGPVFRHQLYQAYKANRPPMPDDLQAQIPFIKSFVAASNILTLEEQGVEADDILASAVRLFTSRGQKVILVSGDKDLLQLVNADVVMWDPMKDREMDREAVHQKYGLYPELLLDLFALIGDTSDNVPGVPGVGPKTAEKLISAYGSLDGLYAHIDQLKQSRVKEQIVANKEQAYLSRQLISLKTDVVIPEEISSYALVGADDEQLAKIYTELEFSSLLKGIDTSRPVPCDGFMTVRTGAELAAMVEELQNTEVLAVDTETTSLTARHARLVGISLAKDLERAWYIPVGHLDDRENLVTGQLSADAVKAAVAPLLLSEKVLKIGHNLKYDITVFKQQWDIDFAGRSADTLIAAYLTESGERSLKLDDLCQARGLRLTSFSEVTGNDKRENCFAYVDVEKAGHYSCEDVYGALVLWQEFAPLLKEKGLEDLFWRVEMPIVAILSEMEIAGICINPAVLAVLSKEFSEKLATLEGQIYQLAGHPFNINSPRQLGQVLFEEQGLTHGRKTKTGFSTDVGVLEKLAVKHQLPALVLQFRTVAKLLSTYVEKLSQLQDPRTGRIHTSFNQAVAATGRLSSSDPNLQNIPIRTEEGSRIRGAFVPAEGLVFLAADYSQIDLRVLAHYSQDKALLGAFRAGEDVHARTAAEIFGVSPLLVTSEMRRVAKSINFGIVYGMSSFGLANQLDIGRKDAQRFIDRYFSLYTGVQRFMGEIVQKARDDGYITTLLGRRRSVPDINAKNKTQREFAERTAINTPIQGTAADIIKLAMIECRRSLQLAGLSARMLLQIHDELVFELPEAEIPATVPIIKSAMEKAMALDVPLVVNCTVGSSLAK
ncbi:MAG: DNA polymerase I [Desulforhopalus sp.]|nr:DNA polymerase I [Desulforhopalus sp.]